MEPKNTITNEKLAGWAQQDRIHELEDKTIEFIQSEQKRTNRLKIIINRASVTCGIIRSNIRV